MPFPYQIGAVSKLTGISVDTLRAWERRYAAVTPQRGERRRGYDQADVDRLILLRRAVERGHSISSVASLPDAELHLLLNDVPSRPERDLSIVRSLMSALDDFDYVTLSEHIGRIGALLPETEIVNDVVLPVMREVGNRWHSGALSIAQEHMITGLMHHLLGTLLGLSRPPSNATRLIFATLEGEMHTMGILAAAMLASNAKLSPVYLGASLPPKEIVQAARRSGAKAVVLQIMDPGGIEPIPKLRDTLPSNVELWLGGSVEFSREGVLWLPDFSALEQNLRRLATV